MKKKDIILTDVDERRRAFFERTKNASGTQFTDYRFAVQTENERKLGQQIMKDYKEAYEAKDRAGVFRDMEIAEAYWSGEFAQKTSDIQSNTNIINNNIETQVADMLDQNVDVEPRAFSPSDAPYIPKVRRVFERILEANKMPLKIERIVRRAKKYGSGWIRVLFNPDMLDGVGAPDIESVSTADVFPDASIMNVDDINQGRYFIERKTASIYWAEQEFGMEKASAIYPGFRAYSENLESELRRDKIDLTKEVYTHLYYWCKHKDENGKERLRLIQASACGVILRDSLDYENEKGTRVFPQEDKARYPYWVYNDMEAENSVWGKTIASLLYPVQDLIDELDNTIRANARLTGNPIKMVLTSSGIDPEKIDNTEGQVVPTNVPNGLTYVNPPALPGYMIDRRNQALASERVIVSRVSDQQSGVKQAGVDTATESLALQQNAMKATDASKTILQLTLADVMMYCLELAMEFWADDMFFEVEENKFEVFNPSMLKNIPVLMPVTNEYRNAFERINPGVQVPEYMENPNKYKKIQLLISVSVGAGLPKNKALMYNIIKETYTNQAMDVVEFRKMLKEYVGLPEPEGMGNGVAPAGAENEVPANMEQGRDFTLGGGVNPKALNRMEAQRTGGNYNAK